MNPQSITTLVHYNFWANDRILAACAHLSPTDFTRPVTPDPGWGNLRGILVHVLDAEYGWRTVLQGQDASSIIDAAAFADVAALQTRWMAERDAWFAYVSTLDDEKIDNDPKVWQTILHVIMHGIQHRAEAAFILTGYGHSPGELDFDVFLQER